MAASVQNVYADNYGSPWSEASVAGIVVAKPFLYTLTAASLFSTASTIKLAQLPGKNLPGFCFLGAVVDVPDLDSSTNVVLQLGDDDTADLYATTALTGTIGQVAGRISSFFGGVASVVGGFVNGSVPNSYPVTDDNNLVLTVSTGPTTATSGKITGVVYYTQWPLKSF